MLRGELVGLRAIEEADLPVLLAWRNEPEFRRFFREHRELSLESQRRWYESLSDPSSNVRMFSIVRLSDSVLMGACGLCYIDSVNRSADFSLYLGIEGLYIDMDYAPDVARVLLKYGFEELNLHRIWAEIYDIDEKKKEFFHQLGFVLDGRMRESHWTEGRWCDSLFFSILNTAHFRSTKED